MRGDTRTVFSLVDLLFFTFLFGNFGCHCLLPPCQMSHCHCLERQARVAYHCDMVAMGVLMLQGTVRCVE